MFSITGSSFKKSPDEGFWSSNLSIYLVPNCRMRKRISKRMIPRFVTNAEFFGERDDLLSLLFCISFICSESRGNECFLWEWFIQKYFGPIEQNVRFIRLPCIFQENKQIVNSSEWLKWKAFHLFESLRNISNPIRIYFKCKGYFLP